ncbi:glycosyltransferase [Patescibacteria group bacterium]|nr:glycosyltransferase [Patescibacteria group bacterium]
MITIAITAYNESATVGKALESILKQKINGNYELIVSAPDDETLAVVKTYQKKYKRIKIIKDKGNGKPAALNLIFKKAKGRIIILTDGDVYLGKNSINFVLEKFKDPKVGVVSGRPISLNSKKSMLGFWSHLLTDIADSLRSKLSSKDKLIVCSGYLYAIKKGIIKRVPEEALSEDAVISHLIFDKGYLTKYAPNALVYVKYPTSFSDWIKQKKRSTGGYNQLKFWVKKSDRMRSFSKESSGIFLVLSKPKNILELFYTTILIFVRLYLWILIFIDINLKKQNLKKIWQRVESTKI